jgi:hypothetical protein
VYLASIVLLMLVLPAASVAIESFGGPGAGFLALVGKWFVFWAVGVRLLVAGIRQAAEPSFTAGTIFGIADKAAEKLVVEIGAANIAIGLLGVLTLTVPDWIVPAAIAGGLYYGIAGIMHFVGGPRNATETIAMVSDLLIFALIAFWLVVTWATPGATMAV